MPSDVTYHREQLPDLWDEMQPLLAKHWREIAHYQDIALDPDKARYMHLDAVGALRVFTARTASWRLIGYSVFMVSPNIHYRQSLQATQDVIYVDPDLRSGRVGMGLIAFGDEQLRADGVQVVYHHAKNAHPALGRLLGHMGYESIETIYARRLDV